MSIEKCINHRLINTAALTALVPSTRIKPLHMVQGLAKPYVVYYIDKGSETELSGRAVGLGTATVNIEIAAAGNDPYNDAKAIRDTVRDTLHGYRGTMGTGGYATAVRTCILESEAESHDPGVDGSDRGTVVVVMSFALGFVEAIPTPA